MKRACLFCLVPFFALTISLSQSIHAGNKSKASVLKSYGKLPLSFEANQGQVDSRVKFFSKTGGYTLFLTGDEADIAFRGGPTKIHGDNQVLARMNMVRMKLLGGSISASVTGLDELPGRSNFFLGNDPAKWRTDIPSYSKVKYKGIYPGIDLLYYGNQRQIEYDFILAAGADPQRIAIDFGGTKGMRRDALGNLVLKTAGNDVRWKKPVAYQEKDGARHAVAVRYVIRDKNRVGFEVASYDRSRPLRIDPVLYSTYLGGGNGDEGVGIALDSTGSVYVTGSTYSDDFPTTNPLQGSNHSENVFVSKLNPEGSALVFSTYLGGSGQDFASGIALDGAGNVYVTGETLSTDFPTLHPVQATLHGTQNAFVTKINSSGSALVYSTYLGGSGTDGATGVAVDGFGRAYVTGITTSSDFPTKNPLQPTYGGGYEDGFVAKLTAAGSALAYSTYLGGSASDESHGIAVDSAGEAYVTGWTSSTDFPTKNALQAATGGGNSDAFVSKINASGTALIYSTYFGGNAADEGNALTLDSQGNAYVAGFTHSPDFPTTPGAYRTSCDPYCSYGDGFITKFNPTGQVLVFSTETAGVQPFGIALDGQNYVYTAGTPWAYTSKMDPTGSSQVYNFPLGLGPNFAAPDSHCTSIAVDSSGVAYATGGTAQTFQIVNALQPVYGGGGSDAFVSKFLYALSVLQLTSSANPAVSGKPIILTATVTSPSGGTPTGTVQFDTYAGQVKKNLHDGKAIFTSSKWPVGTDFGTAYYSGDTNFSASQAARITQIVLQATTITLASSANPSSFGQAVTFSSVVGSSAGAPPDGETISFMSGQTLLGTGALSGGSASITISTLSVGKHSIEAVYGGDSTFASNKAKLITQTVNKGATTSALVSSLNPSTVGQAVTFTASVTPQYSGTASGTVTFKDGSTVLKTTVLTGGMAAYTTSALASGAHTISATYNGNGSFNGSSAPLTQTVH